MEQEKTKRKKASEERKGGARSEGREIVTNCV